MPAPQFHKASKSARKVKAAFVGPPGSGKTYTALLVALGLVGPDGRIAVADSENESSSLYAGRVAEFDSFNLEEPFTPQAYVEVIHAAEEARYDALIIDSLSHAWAGKGGVLEMVDQVTARAQSQNKYGVGWRAVTPEHNKLVDALVRCRCHLIVTMRTKMEYATERDERTGKMTVRKIGLAPIQREGLEYEMDLVVDFNTENTAVISKSRYSSLSGQVIQKPTMELGKQIKRELVEDPTKPPPIPPARPLTDKQPSGKLFS